MTWNKQEGWNQDTSKETSFRYLICSNRKAQCMGTFVGKRVDVLVVDFRSSLY